MWEALLLWVLWSAFCFPLFEYSPHEDFWDHVAAIKAWSESLSHPANPQLATDDGSARYTPFSVLFVYISKLFHIGAIESLEVAAVFNTALFLVGTFLFLQAYFRNTWAPVIGLIVFITFWGTGFRHANEFQLRTLFYGAPYPSTFTFGLGLLALFLTLKIIRSEISVGWSSVSLLILLTISVLSHVLTAAFIMGGIGLLCVTEQGVRMRFRKIPILVAIAAIAVAELWPFFSVREIVFGTHGQLQEGVSWLKPKPYLDVPTRYISSRVHLALGPALLGIPCLLYLAFKRQHLFIVYGFLLMVTPYVINVFWGVPEGGRFLYFAVFFLHMALVWVALEVLEYKQESSRSGPVLMNQKVLPAIVGIVFFGSVVWNLSYAGAHFGYAYFRKEPVPAVMERLSGFLNKDSIVLAPVRIGWPVPSFEGKIVALLQSGSMIPDNRKRAEDVASFFEAKTSSEARLDILRRYRVSHVIFETEDASEEARHFLREAALQLGSVPGYCYPDNVDAIKQNWKNIFRPCEKSTIEVFSVPSGRASSSVFKPSTKL